MFTSSTSRSKSSASSIAFFISVSQFVPPAFSWSTSSVARMSEQMSDGLLVLPSFSRSSIFWATSASAPLNFSTDEGSA